MIDPFGDYKWLPPGRLMELLRELPEDSKVVTNYVGNLSIYDSDELYLGFIDFNLDGSVETTLEDGDIWGYMSQKQPNINCTELCGVRCGHPAAPRLLLSLPYCILLVPSKDMRVPTGCALQVPYPRPMTPITPPPKIQYF